jgi:opacity protein-like surface antigen
MRKLLLPGCVSAFLFALSPAPVAAQGGYGYQGHLEITPLVGLRTGGELETSVSDLFDTDVEIDDSETYGIAIDIPISRGFQVELLANRQESAFRANGALFDDDRRLADVSVENFQAGVLWQWGGGQVNPFFVATLGVAQLDPEVAGAKSENRFAGTLGGGVKVFFSRNFGLRLEGRGYWADLGGDSFDDRCDRHGDYCYDYNYDQDLYQIEGAAGLIISF